MSEGTLRPSSDGTLDRHRAGFLPLRLPAWLIPSVAHLSALWALAVVQPTFEVLGENADVFVARQVEGWSLATTIVGFAVVPPFVLACLEGIAALISERFRVGLHLFFVWALLALLVLYALRQLLPEQDSVLIPAAWLVGAGGTLLYARKQVVASFLSVMSVAPLVFAGYFLLFSPSHELLFPEDVEVGGDVQSRAPIVMLMLDELPIASLMDGRGRIDAPLFPNFAELTKDATWYRNTTASGDFTENAVPAILDGRHPRLGMLPVVSEHPGNVFTLFGRTHRMEVMEYITSLCPSSLCPRETPAPERMREVVSALSVLYGHVIAPPSLAQRLPFLGSTWGESRAAKDPKREVPSDAPRPALAPHGDAQFERFLAAMQPYRAEERPPLHFLHSSLPHVPWKHGASGRLYSGHFEGMPGLLDDGQVWTRDRTLVAHGLQRHLLQTKYADLLVGQLLERMRKLGLYERALLVVTADHGASFRPGGNRRLVDRANAGDVGLVPFFVKAPNQQRMRVIDAHLQAIDILPTMADSLGLRLPWRADGRPARSLLEHGRTRVRILRHEDGDKTFRASLLERHRRQSVRRKLSLFGSGTGVNGLYAIGPDRDLMGRRVADLRPLPDRGSVALGAREEFLAVDPRSRFVPSRATGTVPGGVARVLVAVNGRVEGVAPTYEDGGATRFSVMIREDSLRAGRNQIEVLAASGRRRDRRVSRLRMAE